MLLFISPSCFADSRTSGFQYITCYFLSHTALNDEFVNACFNTSHVTLYRRGYDMSYMSKRSFNTSHVTLYQSYKDLEERGLLGFNTSHVTLYRSSGQPGRIHGMRFNTSHVTLYRQTRLFHSQSIFIVSIHHMLLFIALTERCLSSQTGFNTSHVTLYRRPWRRNCKPGKFQYITCYSLYGEKWLEKDIQLFQYITCYSLCTLKSKSHGHAAVSIHHMLLFIMRYSKDKINDICFNTSHVTLYAAYKDYCKQNDRFNTSHVTLYRQTVPDI